MSVNIKDIKNKSVSSSSNPFDEWEKNKKEQAKPDDKTDNVTNVTTSNPFDEYLKKKSGTEGGTETSNTLSQDAQTTSPVEDKPQPTFFDNLRGYVKQGVENKLNSGTTTSADLEYLKKNNPDQYIALAKEHFPDPGDAFLKSQTASKMLLDNINNKAKERNFIESKNYDADYYNNLNTKIIETAKPINDFFKSTGIDIEIKPTDNVEESKGQLKVLTDAERTNTQQIDRDKTVNFILPNMQQPVIFDVTKMTDEEIEARKNQDEGLYNRLVSAKQKVAQGNKIGSIIHNAITPIQTKFGSNTITEIKNQNLADPNKDGNDYVRQIGEGIYKLKDPETFAIYQKAGGYDKSVPYSQQKFNSDLDQVNKEIMTLGYNALRGDVAAKGTDSQYANIYDNLKYLDYKFSTPKEQETRHRIAVSLKENGINPSDATEDQKDEAARQLPLDNQEVWFNKSKQSGDTDLPNTGFLYSAGKSAVKTGTNILQSGSVVSPTSWATLFLGKSTDKELANEILRDRMHSDIIGENPESKQRYDELRDKEKEKTITTDEQNELNDLSSFTDKRTSWDKFKDGNGSMAGMMAAITVDALPTLIGGAASRAVAGATEIPLLENGVNKTLIQKLNVPTSTNDIINFAKNKNEMFVLMHHENAKRAMELFPEDDTKKAWYTGITDVISVALPNILPTKKLGELFNTESKDVVAGLVGKLSEDNVDKAVIDNMMQEAAKKIISKTGTFLVGAEKTAAEASLVMSLMNLGNNVTQAALKPDSISGGDITNNFLQTFSSTFLDSQLVGLIGGYGAVQKKYGEVGVDAIYDATDNVNAVNSVKYTINDQLSKGELKQEEANKKISLLQTAAELRPAVNDLQKEENLTTPESKRVFINLLNERILKNKVKTLKDAGSSEALIKPVEDRIKEINDINSKIIGKDIIVNEDMTLIDRKVKEKQDADKLEAQQKDDELNNQNEQNKLSETEKAKQDTEIQNTFNNLAPKLSEDQIKIVEPVIDRVHGAEYINENDLNDAQDVLYDALDKHPESAHLIEPLIQKLQDYDFATTTKTSTATEKVPVEGTFGNRSKPIEIKPALEHTAGSEATVTDSDGIVKTGTLNIKGGSYVLDMKDGQQIVLGEKAITDRDISLPENEPQPVKFNENGDVESITLQLNKVDKENGGKEAAQTITIKPKDQEKALDLAIQLQADAIGKVPDEVFDKAYETVIKEVPIEVLKNKPSAEKVESKEDISSSTKPINNGNEKNGENANGKESPTKQSEQGSKEQNGESGKGSSQEQDVLKKEGQSTTEGTAAPLKEGGGKEPPNPKVEADNEDEAGKRRFTKQVLKDENITPESKKTIAENIDYVVQTNEMSIAEANSTIDKIGVDESYNLVTGNNDVKPAVRAVMGQVLIKKYNDLAIKATDVAEKNYYTDKTIDIANYVSDKLATQPGQMIQALSLFPRLSPEGQLRAAIKDQAKQAQPKKNKAKADVDELGNKLKKINEETADEVIKSPKVKKATEKTESDLKVKSKDKIKKAQENRANIIKKYKEDKGKNLYAGVGLTKEGIEFVGNLVKTYIDEGIGEVGLIIDKVLQELKNVSGKEVTDEVKNNVNDIISKQGESLVSKNAVSGIRSLESEVGKIVKEHYTVKDAEKKKLVDKFIEKLGFDNESAKELAKEIETEFDRIATRKKEQMLTEEKKRWQRIQDGLKGSKKENDLQSQMIKYSNLGAFDNSSLLNMLADKLGLGKITPEEGQRITELAKKIELAPEGSPKRNATEQLLVYRANLKGTSWGEIAQGAWYAQVLSGYATHIRNLVSTFANTMSFFGVEALRNPKAIPFLFLGMERGISRIGVVEAAHTVRTGQTPIHISKVETPDVLERTNFKGGMLNPTNWLKYVGRLMKAEDVLLFQGLKEMRATQLALREANSLGYKTNPFNKNVYKKVNELLLNTKERYDQSVAQIKLESPSLKEGTREHNRRIYELMELSRPIQMTEDAYGFAAKGTFNHETEGTLGAISDSISSVLDNSLQVGGLKLLRFVIPFTRIITNVANNTLDFSPIGMVRAAAGKRGLLATEASGKRVDMTKEERIQTTIKASLGIASAATLYALAANGQVEVTGAGPSDLKKKLQLIEQGWQSYSIKVGDKYYSYKLTPFVFAWGLVGSIRDHEVYDKDADEQSIAERTALVTWDGIKNIGDMTWVGSAAPLMAAMASSNENEVQYILSNTASRTAKTFVPIIGSNFYSQTAQKIEQVFNIPQKKSNNFFQSLIQDVPIARNFLNDKINALGDPVVRDVDVLVSTEKNDPVWKYLGEKKAWVAPVNKNTIIVFDQDTKKDRPVTDDEYYEFSKLRGSKIKTELKNVLQFGATVDGETKTSQQLTTAQLQKVLGTISTKATKEAKKELFEIHKKHKGEKIKVNSY